MQHYVGSSDDAADRADSAGTLKDGGAARGQWLWGALTLASEVRQQVNCSHSPLVAKALAAVTAARRSAARCVDAERVTRVRGLSGSRALGSFRDFADLRQIGVGQVIKGWV